MLDLVTHLVICECMCLWRSIPSKFLWGGGGGGGLVVALYVLSASLKMKWMLNNIYHLSLLNLLLQVLIGLKVKWGGSVGRGRGRERARWGGKRGRERGGGRDGEEREGEGERERGD